MWAVVDAGLGTITELQNEWCLEDYCEAVEYLAEKAKAQQQQQEMAQLGRR